jgi:hypothetical protein
VFKAQALAILVPVAEEPVLEHAQVGAVAAQVLGLELGLMTADDETTVVVDRQEYRALLECHRSGPGR